MDNASDNGNNSLLLTIFLGIFSWVTPETMDIGLKIITATGAVVAAFFATRYHYYAAKEKKEQLKKLRERQEDDEIFS
jgi:hypothetical protein